MHKDTNNHAWTDSQDAPLNNFQQLAEDKMFQASNALKAKVRSSVFTNLNIIKFVGNLFELYVGNASRVVTGLLADMEEPTSHKKKEITKLEEGKDGESTKS